MKYHYITKNPELTSKALTYIFHSGRNAFDKMINDLLSKRICPIKQGWLIKKKG